MIGTLKGGSLIGFESYSVGASEAIRTLNSHRLRSATKNGEFIGCSTSHLQKEILAFDKAECSRTWQHSFFMETYLHMNTPNVVKVFI